jgi:hypothetical protein
VPVPTPLEFLRAHLAPLDARSAPAIELSLSGLVQGEALFALRAEQGRWSVEPGGAADAAFVLSAHWADLIDLIEGYGSVEAALIDRRLMIAGDLTIAMRWIPRLFTASGSR